MIDIKVLRESPDLVRASQSARGEDVTLVDRVIAADEIRRSAIVEFEALKAEQNSLSKSVGSAKGDEKAALLEKAKALSDLVKAAEGKKNTTEAEYKNIAMSLSNIVDKAAPVGGEADFKVLEEVGKPRDFNFTPKDHVELGKILGAIDVERAAKVSGARFYYLTGVGALLELALVNYAITSASKAGFIPVIPPVLVKPAAMEGTGFLGQAAENVFHLKDEDFYLVGTSEVALAALHMDEILDAKSLPIRYAGYSPCFRKEAGSYGKDTRGIIRVHQFDKVEIVQIVDPEKSYAVLEEMVVHVEQLLKSLELPYRILRLCGGDMSFASALTYDFEVFSAAQQKWLEVSSVSNFESFQANRLKLRFKDEKGKTQLAHTLNGSSLALPRIMASLLENNQEADGIKLPAALHAYMGMNKIS